MVWTLSRAVLRCQARRLNGDRGGRAGAGRGCRRGTPRGAAHARAGRGLLGRDFGEALAEPGGAGPRPRPCRRWDRRRIPIAVSSPGRAALGQQLRAGSVAPSAATFACGRLLRGRSALRSCFSPCADRAARRLDTRRRWKRGRPCHRPARVGTGRRRGRRARRGRNSKGADVARRGCWRSDGVGLLGAALGSPELGPLAPVAGALTGRSGALFAIAAALLAGTALTTAWVCLAMQRPEPRGPIERRRAGWSAGEGGRSHDGSVGAARAAARRSARGRGRERVRARRGGNRAGCRMPSRPRGCTSARRAPSSAQLSLRSQFPASSLPGGGCGRRHRARGSSRRCRR